MSAQLETKPVTQITRALATKRYRRIAIFDVDQQNTSVDRIETWAKAATTLILVVYEDGGCELYRPLSESLLISDTMAAIPD